MQEYIYGVQMRNQCIHFLLGILTNSVKLVGQRYATTTCQCQLMYIFEWDRKLMIVILRVPVVRLWWDIILQDLNLVIHVPGQTIMLIIIY
jgi:hypothetical protein